MKETRKIPSMFLQSISTQVKTKREPLYSVSDIASLTELTLGVVNYRIKKLGLEPESKSGNISVGHKGKSLYSKSAMELIKNFKESEKIQSYCVRSDELRLL